MPLTRLMLAAALLCGALARPAPAHAQPEIQMCTGQPVPAGYVIVRTDLRGNCPAGLGAAYNTVTIRQPGDSVTVCSELSRLAEGYVVTRRELRGNCPASLGAATNTATYRRVGAGPGYGDDAAPGGFAPMDAYDRTVFRRMAETVAWLGLRTPTHHPWLARAAHGATARTSLPLAGGTRYTLVATCDDDCDDLDLRVMDGGYLLAEDTGTGESATVQLTPARDVRVTVEAVMASCAQSPCHLAVGVYETPGPGAVPPRRPPGGDVRVLPRPRPNP